MPKVRIIRRSKV